MVHVLYGFGLKKIIVFLCSLEHNGNQLFHSFSSSSSPTSSNSSVCLLPCLLVWSFLSDTLDITALNCIQLKFEFIFACCSPIILSQSNTLNFFLEYVPIPFHHIKLVSFTSLCVKTNKQCNRIRLQKKIVMAFRFVSAYWLQLVAVLLTGYYLTHSKSIRAFASVFALVLQLKQSYLLLSFPLPSALLVFVVEFWLPVVLIL